MGGCRLDLSLSLSLSLGVWGYDEETVKVLEEMQRNCAPQTAGTETPGDRTNRRDSCQEQVSRGRLDCLHINVIIFTRAT